MRLDALTGLHENDQTALVRVAFSDDAAWQHLATLVRETSFEDEDEDEEDYSYLPDIVVVDDRSYDGATAASIAATVDRTRDELGYVLLVDALSVAEVGLGLAATVVYVDLTRPFDQAEEDGFGRAFRCVIAEVASIEANLAVGNMDFWEFADHADEHGGVFRGFE